MITIPMSEIARQIGAQMIGRDTDISTIFTDSRRNNSSGLFVALKGPHFDAHGFIHEVLANGASGVVVDHVCENAKKGKKSQIVVNNTRIALAEIARLNRNKSTAKYVAITGSSGKTTVKEMVASILQLSGKTFATKGNLNNDIGVPLTLLEIDETIEFGVVELGANHAGEVAFTADITRPDVALVNNVSAAHLEGFGDLYGVASAKREIYSALSDKGIAILNKDDDFFDYFQKRIHCRQLTFSTNQDADVCAKNIQLNDDQRSSFELHYQQQQRQINLPIVGEHNVANALAAASCCLAINIPLELIVRGLENTPVVSGRLVIHKLNSGCRIIDDTYNANVGSTKAAIDLLKNYPEPKILVLGDMGELGELGRQCHQQVGEYAKKSNINKLYTCGVLTQFTQAAFDDYSLETELVAPKSARLNDDSSDKSDSVLKDKGRHFYHQQELLIKLKQEVAACSTILIKGSRSTHMENIVQALIDDSKQLDISRQSGLRDACLETSTTSLKRGD